MHGVSVIAKLIDYRCKSWAHIAETKLMYFLCEEGKSSESLKTWDLSDPHSKNFQFLMLRPFNEVKMHAHY